jgi:hypothetical protein
MKKITTPSSHLLAIIKSQGKKLKSFASLILAIANN